MNTKKGQERLRGSKAEVKIDWQLAGEALFLELRVERALIFPVWLLRPCS